VLWFFIGTFLMQNPLDAVSLIACGSDSWQGSFKGGTAPFFRFKLSANPRLRETQWKRSQRLTTVLYDDRLTSQGWQYKASMNLIILTAAAHLTETQRLKDTEIYCTAGISTVLLLFEHALLLLLVFDRQ